MQGFTQMLAGIRGANEPEAVRAAIAAYFESWRTGDIDARATLFADDASFADPVGSPKFEGIQAIRGFWANAARAPIDTRPEIERVIVCGDEALVVFTMFLEMNGKTVGSLQVHERFVFGPDGKISELHPFWDSDSVNRNLPAS